MGLFCFCSYRISVEQNVNIMAARHMMGTTDLHGVTFRKMITSIITALKASNHKQYSLFPQLHLKNDLTALTAGHESTLNSVHLKLKQ
jgi:hypothetical protein